MSSKHPLKLLVERQKNGRACGMYSICSANEYVITAAMERAMAGNDYVLIEATANQVNQFGGYTGMKPADFRDFVYSLALKAGFPYDKILLGGDHLGPLTWQAETAETALEKSRELIRQYVLAGFTKIHIDTSMKMADDSLNIPMSTAIIADRGAMLVREAELAFAQVHRNNPEALEPVYVVGSEVPIPGGSRDSGECIHVTEATDFESMVETFKQAFHQYQLESAWANVIAVVVQPGVEYGDERIHEYERPAARRLSRSLQKYPGLVFEGHSTDYQTAHALKEMVEDGIAILKVGPALTFALREGLFALSHMEAELFRFSAEVEQSRFIEVLDSCMAYHPENWLHHYHGRPGEIRYARKFSFSDRCRYYLPAVEVQTALERLMKNLQLVDIPLTLLSQFMPVQYKKVRDGLLQRDAESLLKDRIINCIDEYLYAVKPGSS
ncbi:D-tagatose-1,6-bisphosphate aldolase subunit GatZ [Propionispora sp. 2/2-37]|uniref:class II D-tagatose-bisphosphate aldolase, non-catalytic subunit n=1 Tax=Propionispora sp. 2/2-37 TaxID=1677858 RepID=UPI0006BB6B68|nr:class II D-tagatose-bisphosphate aldolase, non-catalytic subunit [Propionispora sp. 2/2-37]CUH95130.1 D-tagatose-1,6-bisphosphate aldolase subunit GatZ [Propionispora sp. 2/2-37]